jgi:hypothetical protein
VVVMLVQFTLKQWRKNVAPAPSERGRDDDAEEEAAPVEAAVAAAELQYRTQAKQQQQSQPVMPAPPRPDVAVPRLLVNLPPPRGPVSARAYPIASKQALPSRRSPSRYSRAALMPSRRAVRQAFVINAILQPCHAHRPPDSD